MTTAMDSAHVDNGIEFRRLFRKFCSFPCISLVMSLLILNAGPAWAKITLQGTAAEKTELQQAIDDAKNSSPATKALYEALEARAETVVVKYGPNIDIAVANTATLEVTIDQTKLAKFDQIGAGQAKEQITLKYVIVHEALGHILNKLQGKPFGEPAAMATTNQLRKDDKSATRTKYVEESGGKTTIPFSDGSAIDLTRAFEAPSGGTGKPFVGITENVGSINLTGTQDTGAPEFKLTIAQSGTSRMALGFGDGSSTTVDINNLGATFIQIPEDPLLPGINLEGIDFGMDFSSFNWYGSDTGSNFLGMIDPSRTMSGKISFLDDNTFVFNIVGDFLWSNALFDNGYAVEYLSGMMQRGTDNTWIGTASLTGVKYAIPEPGTLYSLILGLGFLALVRDFNHDHAIA